MAKKKGGKTGIILIIVLLVVILILFSVGFFLLYKTIQKGNQPQEQKPIVVEEKVSREDIILFPVGEEAIVTNLLEGPDGKKHVIKLKVNLGIDSSKKHKKEAAKLIEILTAQTPVIEDTILGICRNKTIEELKRNDAQALLADEIKLRLSEAFDTNLIVEVIINKLLHE